MAYQVLYREWRPQDFKSLVGQQHISMTLQNAIKKSRIAHAYLFAGPWGTGKTSTAKILAKAVNCLNPVDAEPCNSCANCESINGGRSLDVIEIDAASNRGIDEIRELRERVNFVPSQGKYKVYIIDEVHMLTTEAFNALLKILEEPPAHVIFILATTEPQRILPTILSRCQRFDFRKIAPQEMEERLKEILSSYGLSCEEGVLALIIRKAEGGLRDAISILDQCISFGEDCISQKTAYDVLGMVKSDALLSLTQSFIDKDAPRLLAEINMLLKQGLEPGQIIKDLLEHLRNLILLSVCGTESLLVSGSNEEKENLLKQAKALGLGWLSDAVSLLAKVDSESRWRQNMRIVLETTLLGLILREKTANDSPAGNTTILPPKAVNTCKAESSAVAQPAKKPAVVSGMTLASIKDNWDQLMEEIKERKKTVHAFLTVCEPYNLEGDTLVLAFKSGYTFHKEKVEGSENRRIIEEVLQQVLGVKLQVKCILEDEAVQQTEDPVQKALDLFGPDIVVIKD